MNKRKKLALTGVCILIFLALLIRSAMIGTGRPDKKETLSNGSWERITRAETAKLISLLFYDREELLKLPREILFTDTEEKSWYDKYINGLYELGLTGSDIEEARETFRPGDFLKPEELSLLLDRLCAQREGLEPSKLLEEAKVLPGGEAHVKREDFLKLYGVLTDKLAEGKVERKELFIYSTGGQEPTLGEGLAATDAGRLYTEGLPSEDILSRGFSVLIRGDVILNLEEEKDEYLLQNVWLQDKKNGGKELSVFYDGIGRTLPMQEALVKTPKGVVADLLMKGGRVARVSEKTDIISGKVLKADRDSVVLETEDGEKRLTLNGNFKIYRTYGKLGTETAKGILIGYSNTDFVLEGDKICAALIKSSLEAKNIRVLLKTQDFKALFHEKAVFTCDGPFTVKYGKKEKDYKAGQRVTVKPDSDWLKAGEIMVKSKEPNGRLKLLSFKRNGEYPSYRGTLDISLYDSGLVLVNELLLEEYLYGVVPSEMPSSYGVEALKVQAVCARSYAYNQLLSNSYGKYGAHVDDSVAYQVYNNLPENENTILAVRETYGQVLEYQNAVITAYYFSTSCGHTSSAYEVWPGTAKEPYLKGGWQNRSKVKGEKPADLSLEENFKSFITQSPANTYDSQSAWFRWKTQIDAEELKKTVDTVLSARYQANPALVLTQDSDGVYRSIPVDTVGEVVNITVSDRALSGMAREVILEGSERTVKIITEYNIRTLLGPRYDTVTRQDESTVEQLSMLPSAYFVVSKKEKGGKRSFLFTGGGYGHGVGMSQNGAKCMADDGFSYEDILRHYYPGIEIGTLY